MMAMPGEKTRIAVLVSGGGTNLQHLMDSEKKGGLPHGEIVLVVSNRKGAYALQRAKEAGIESLYIPRKKEDPQRFEEKLIEALESHRIDLIILAGFLSILSPAFIRRFPDRILNVHPSLIPSFCGKGYYGLIVHEKALERGVKVTGATVHLVNEIPDGGRIILQKAVEVKEGDCPESLQKRVMEEAEWILLPQAAELFAKKIAEEKTRSLSSKGAIE